MKVDCKERIIEESVNLFLKYGISETGVADIAQAAGISKGTLYYHFKNKEAIITEITDRFFAKMDAVINAFASENPFIKGIGNVVEFLLNILQNNVELEKLNYVLLAYGVIRMPELKKQFSIKYAEWVEVIKQCLDRYNNNDASNQLYSQIIFTSIAGFAICKIAEVENMEIDSNQLTNMVEELYK